MAISDPIADMLTRIRNAAKAKFNSVDVPGSTLKIELAKILKNEGYIRNYKFLKDGKQGILRLYLKYGLGQSNVIYGLKRISKPSRRVYVKPCLVRVGDCSEVQGSEVAGYVKS
jgi:small subunit ribosomal protein S8